MRNIHPGLWVIAGLGAFILASAIMMWWAINQEGRACHPVHAQRISTDDRNSAAVACL
jgi:hypothetical protein